MDLTTIREGSRTEKTQIHHLAVALSTLCNHAWSISETSPGTGIKTSLLSIIIDTQPPSRLLVANPSTSSGFWKLQRAKSFQPAVFTPGAWLSAIHSQRLRRICRSFWRNFQRNLRSSIRIYRAASTRKGSSDSTQLLRTASRPVQPLLSTSFMCWRGRSRLSCLLLWQRKISMRRSFCR